MNQKIINKIAIVISWPREIYLFQNFFKRAYQKKIEFIVNDVKSFERGRNKSNILIQQILNSKNIKFKLFSKVFEKKKFRIVISTGEISAGKVDLSSLSRYLYVNTIGSLFKITKFYKILHLVFNRPFTGNPSDRHKVGANWFPEKKLGNIAVKYPDGSDLKLKNYPYNIYKDVFDIFLSYSQIDLKLVKKKFSNKICKKVSYFNYKKNDLKIFKNSIIKDYGFDKKKPFILWAPTHIEIPSEEDRNILSWCDKILFLNKKYNFLIRPHPKSLCRNPTTVEFLLKKKLTIDTKFNRDTRALIQSFDLIISDYGGIVFDSVYYKKNIILLNMAKKSKYVEELMQSDSLDIKFRKRFLSLDHNLNFNDIENIIMKAFSKKYAKSILSLRSLIFGSKKGLETKQLINFLERL